MVPMNSPAGPPTMTTLSPNAQLVSTIFEQVAQGNGAPFWEACHDDIVWRTIGSGSWSGEFVGKQTIVDEIFRPLNRVLAERDDSGPADRRRRRHRPAGPRQEPHARR